MTAAEVCTTQGAAEILGISVTSVQQLVESGAIEAWKTKGGHRRIPLAAVHAYKAAPGAVAENDPVPAVLSSSSETSILVIEDNRMQRGIYANQLSSWNLGANISYCENGYQALIAIARQKPDVLLADIVMEGIDGYEVIKTILAYPDLADIHIAILSSLNPAELDARGGIPTGVAFFSKPVNYEELRGYLRACCAQKARRHAAQVAR